MLVAVFTSIGSIVAAWYITHRYHKRSQENEPEWHVEDSSEYSLSPREKRIKELLNERDPKLGKIYEGALKTFKAGVYPENLSQSAHSFRELTNCLPRYLDLSRLTLGKDNGVDLTHRETMERIIAQTSDLEELSPSVRERVEEKAKEWHDLHKKHFVKIAHHGRFEDISPSDFEKKISEFNDILLQILPQHYTRSDELERLVGIMKPEEDDVDQALELLITQPASIDFYSKAPMGWYEKLDQRDIFNEPPSIKVEDDKVKTPRWPPAIFLARLAKDRPDIFLSKISEINSDNIRVLDDLIDGFMELPVSKSEQASKQISEWVKMPYFEKSRASAKIEDLIEKWLNRTRHKSVLHLLEALTELDKVENVETRKTASDDPKLDNLKYYHLKHIFESIEYSEIETDVLENYLTLFIKRLTEAIDLSLQMASTQEDSSNWRPAIEKNEQNEPERNDLRELFLVQVRKVAEELIEKIPQQAEQKTESLLTSSYSAIQRIGLHLLRENFNKMKDLTNEVVMDREFFTNVDYHHEYYLLLKEHFGDFQRDTQEQILRWISEYEGLDLEERKSFHKKRTGEEITKEELQEQFRFWQYERLYPIRDYLGDEWRKEFENLDEEFQTPTHPEFQVYTSAAWVGAKSPISQEELSEKTPEEVKRYMLNWEQPDKEFSLEEQIPSRRGLARALSSDVQERPEEYAKKYLVFKDKSLHPQLISQIFRGFSQALDQDLSFSWKNILKLADWCSSVDWDEEFGSVDVEVRWQHTVRKSIGWLLRRGLVGEGNIIPRDLEQVVWSIIDSLLSDSEPDREYEREHGLNSRPPTEVAINTVRGTAMEALVYYCIWCSKITESELKVKFRTKDSKIPQKAVNKLERHLDPEFEHSISIHSMYGRYFRTLYSLDEDWAQSNLDNIFPAQDDRRWTGAWGAYIMFNNPSKSLFDLLKLQYKKAVENISEKEEGSKATLFGHLQEYNRRLAGHLMAFYWHSSKTIEEHNLINIFQNSASDKIRAMAVSQLGNIFKNDDPPKNSPKWEKAVEYWKDRLRSAEQESKSRSFEKEISSFLSWPENIPRELSSKIMPLIEDSLHVDIDIDDVRLKPLLSYISEISNGETEKVVNALEAIVQKSGNFYWMSRSEEECRKILENGLKHNEQTKRKSLSIINAFGRQGRDNFEDLWEKHND